MIETSTTSAAAATVKGEKSKYILFSLAGECYGFPILQAREIISDYELTVLPKLPQLFHGVINLRGEAIPVVNLRRRFELPDAVRDGSSRVIIVEAEPAVGVQVDQVQRVVTLDPADIEKPPELTCGQRTWFLSGVTQLVGGKFAILLDMARILGSLEQIELAGLGATLARVPDAEAAAGAPPGEPPPDPPGDGGPLQEAG